MHALTLLLGRIRRRRRDAGLPDLTIVAVTATSSRSELPHMALAAGLQPNFHSIVAKAGFDRPEISLLVAFEPPHARSAGSMIACAVAGVLAVMDASGLDMVDDLGGAALAFVRYTSAAGAAANALAEQAGLATATYTGKMGEGLQRLVVDALLRQLTLMPSDEAQVALSAEEMESDLTEFDTLPPVLIARLKALAEEFKCKVRVVDWEGRVLLREDAVVARGKHHPPTLWLRHDGGGHLSVDAVAATCAFGTALDLPREISRVRQSSA